MRMTALIPKVTLDCADTPCTLIPARKVPARKIHGPSCDRTRLENPGGLDTTGV